MDYDVTAGRECIVYLINMLYVIMIMLLTLATNNESDVEVKYTELRRCWLYAMKNREERYDVICDLW